MQTGPVARSVRDPWIVALIVCALAACGGAEKQAPDTAAAPIVAGPELPVALRAGTPLPNGAVVVEVTTAAVQFAQKPLLTLNAGAFAPADRQGNEVPKLIAALKAGPHSAVGVSSSALVPYDTLAVILASIQAAGATSVGIQVRAPSSVQASGYLALDGISFRAPMRRNEADAIPGVATRPWSDFTAHWEEIQAACGRARTGSCTPKPEKIAEGGELKIVLHAAGQGVNVEFFRVGPLPEAAAPETEKPAKGKGKAAASKVRKDKKKSKKHPELIDGVKASPDIADEIENALPATEALFQFRAQEALTAPSAISDLLKPVCGATACGVVVQAEKATTLVRVISLLGAAFPEGMPVPHVVFEWP
ncbi:MAG: hypothetical protein RL701_5884 [Pseudomonadota bacterium]